MDIPMAQVLVGGQLLVHILHIQQPRLLQALQLMVHLIDLEILASQLMSQSILPAYLIEQKLQKIIQVL